MSDEHGVCCCDCGREIDDPQERWAGETSAGDTVVELLCEECAR